MTACSLVYNPVFCYYEAGKTYAYVKLMWNILQMFILCAHMDVYFSVRNRLAVYMRFVC